MKNAVDTYIQGFPKEVRVLLETMRFTIKKAAPDAEEIIKYAMPTFFLHGNLVHFAAYKQHIGFYPAPSGLKAFEKEIARYKNSKGAVQFPLDKPLPLSLVSKIVKFRVKENTEKMVTKKKLNVCEKGHTFQKSSDCPVCPVCEKKRNPTSSFLSLLSAPARRALEHEGISTLKQVSKYSQRDLLKLHGLGKSTMIILEELMTAQNLSFTKATK